MSDTTTLSLQYAASAAFAEEVSRRLLALKKDEGPAPGDDPHREARAFLAGVLCGLLERLRPDGHTPDEAMSVPEEVFGRLEERHRSDADWFADDLRAACSALREGRPLDARAWEILDEVADAADATASASFRRLWRR